MKKKIILIVSTIAIVASLVFALVACNSNPAGFFEKAQDAKEMTAISYDKDGEQTSFVSFNDKGEFITDLVSAKFTGSDLYLYVKTGETWKKAKIDVKHPLYVTTKASMDVMGSIGGLGNFDVEEELFKKDGDFWHITVLGLTDKSMGFKYSGSKISVYMNIDDEMVLTTSVELKANIKLPEGASDATLVNADELK